MKNKDGSFYTMDVWSSGRAYKICPKCYFELFADEHISKMSELGFEGIHYVDVVTILTLLECHDKNTRSRARAHRNGTESLCLKAERHSEVFPPNRDMTLRRRLWIMFCIHRFLCLATVCQIYVMSLYLSGR